MKIGYEHHLPLLFWYVFPKVSFSWRQEISPLFLLLLFVREVHKLCCEGRKSATSASCHDFPLISSLNRSLIIISWSLLLECFLIYSGNGGVFWSQDGVLTVSQITSNQVFVGDLDFFCNCYYLIAVEYGPSNTPGFLLLNYCHCCCYVWLNLSFQVLHHLFPVCYKICSLWCKIGDEL